MADTAKTRGHAHQQSVADAATLFGSDAEDPFASITSSLGAMPEAIEEESAAEDGVHETAPAFGEQSVNGYDDLYGYTAPHSSEVYSYSQEGHHFPSDHGVNEHPAYEHNTQYDYSADGAGDAAIYGEGAQFTYSTSGAGDAGMYGQDHQYSYAAPVASDGAIYSQGNQYSYTAPEAGNAGMYGQDAQHSYGTSAISDGAMYSQGGQYGYPAPEAGNAGTYGQDLQHSVAVAGASDGTMYTQSEQYSYPIPGPGDTGMYEQEARYSQTGPIAGDSGMYSHGDQYGYSAPGPGDTGVYCHDQQYSQAGPVADGSVLYSQSNQYEYPAPGAGDAEGGVAEEGSTDASAYGQDPQYSHATSVAGDGAMYSQGGQYEYPTPEVAGAEAGDAEAGNVDAGAYGQDPQYSHAGPVAGGSVLYSQSDQTGYPATTVKDAEKGSSGVYCQDPQYSHAAAAVASDGAMQSQGDPYGYPALAVSEGATYNQNGQYDSSAPQAGEDAMYGHSEAQTNGKTSQIDDTYEQWSGYAPPSHTQDLQAEQNSSTGYFDNVSAPFASHIESGEQNARSLDYDSTYAPSMTGNTLALLGNGAYVSQERAPDVAEERQRARIPLASFSIDGKLLTFFPTWSQDVTSEDAYGAGSDAYGIGRSGAPTKVTLRPLRSVVPPTSYASSKNPLDFPGPALESIASQGSALSRATGSSMTVNKSKKGLLIKYLNDAAAEMASGIGYLAAGKNASEARRMQDRVVILRVLVILLEQDGNLHNNSVFDKAIKDLLLADDAASSTCDTWTSIQQSSEPVPGPSAARKTQIHSQIEVLLMAGKRKEAVDCAVHERLWTHAVIIASGMDRATWRDVVGQFVEEEFDHDSPVGHHGLKVAYNLFSGQEPKATCDLFRPKTALSGDGIAISAEEDAHVSHSQWRKSVATILANRSNGDAATLTALGDGLKLSGWIEAAHVCYLLSPSTSAMEGYDGSSTRLTLLGSLSPEASTSFVRDLDHIILTEVLEFALSLPTVPKGAEPYHGLAFLQPYRLVHAHMLAEMGEVKQALRYCESIMSLLKNGKMNSYYHPVLLNQLQELTNRLQGDTKNSSWTKKKPTMDGVWSALEGRFTKFIAGEDEMGKDGARGIKKGGDPAIGPFTHYSAITPEAQSRGISRVQSAADFGTGPSLGYASSQTQSRPGSAAGSGFRSGLSPLHTGPHPTVSEQNYGDWTPPRRESSGRSSPKQSVGQASSDSDLYAGPYTTHATSGAPWYGQEAGGDGDTYDQGLTPTDTAYYGYQPHGAAHPQFVSNVENTLSDAMQGASLEEPTDILGNAPTPGPSLNAYAPSAHRNLEDEEDEEDLGFGNKSHQTQRREGGQDDRARAEGGSAADSQSSTQEKKTAESGAKAAELKPASSWFGRFWKRDTSEGGETKAKKAHLGEETSFYYDSELKRWVNKKAGDTGQGASTPPPPPRASTASPSTMRGPSSRGYGETGNMPSSMSEAPPRRVMSDVRPPPHRNSTSGSSFSSMSETPPISEVEEPQGGGDAASSSPSKATRTRSKLADLSQPPALQPGQGPPPSRPGTTDGGPPRSMSAAKKKPISKRYVRVD